VQIGEPTVNDGPFSLQRFELAVRLGVDPRKADQMVRGTVSLPHGTGKTARVAVFATGETPDPATIAQLTEERGFESLFFPEHLERTIRRLDERCRVVKFQGTSETIELSVPLVDAWFLRGYISAMSTVTEVKVATERLSAQDRWELYRWLGESEDVRQFRHEELRREIIVGIEQASRGDQAPLDMQAIKDEVHHRLNHKGN